MSDRRALPPAMPHGIGRYASRVRQNNQVTSNDLRQALDNVLASKTVSTPVTKPVGCAIVRELAE